MASDKFSLFDPQYLWNEATIKNFVFCPNNVMVGATINVIHLNNWAVPLIKSQLNWVKKNVRYYDITDDENEKQSKKILDSDPYMRKNRGSRDISPTNGIFLRKKVEKNEKQREKEREKVIDKNSTFFITSPVQLEFCIMYGRILI